VAQRADDACHGQVAPAEQTTKAARKQRAQEELAHRNKATKHIQELDDESRVEKHMADGRFYSNGKHP
jgi:hypothetical protein